MNPAAENETQEIAVGMAPGFLETSEEVISMKPFREHPKGLAAYKRRGNKYIVKHHTAFYQI